MSVGLEITALAGANSWVGIEGEANVAIERAVDAGSVEQHAQEAFAFVGHESAASIELVRTATQTQLNYLLPELFIEVELDWREGACFVLTGLPVAGMRPSGYYLDDQGRHVRWHLAGVLTAGGYLDRARALKGLAKQSGLQAMMDQVDAYAAEVQAHLKELPSVVQRLQSPRTSQ
jgi:hypothetical protein